MPPTRMLLTLAWRNLKRRTWRTALAGTALALALALLVVTLAVIEGIFAQMVRGATLRYAGDAIAVPLRSGPSEASTALIADAAAVRNALRGASGVRGASARLRVPALLSSGDRRAAADVLGIVPADEAAVTTGDARLLGGAPGLSPDGRGLLLASVLAARLGAGPGSRVALLIRAADGLPAATHLTVVGVVATGDPRRDATLAVTGIETLRALAGTPGAAHEIGLALDDPEFAAEAAARIGRSARLESRIDVVPWQRRVPALAEAIRFSRVTSWWLVALFYAAAGLVTFNVLLVAVEERRREHALCLALGMPPSLLRGVILAESLILGTAAVAVGGALGVLASLGISSRGLDLSWLVGPIGYAGGTLLPVLGASLRGADLLRASTALLAVCAVAGWLPGRALARIAPARALADRESR